MEKISIFLKTILKIWAYLGFLLICCFLIYFIHGGVTATVLLLILIIGIFYYIQDHFLFYPDLPSHSRIYVPKPSVYGLPYESIHIKGSDGTKIHMYFISQTNSKQMNSPTIIFFHGNAGNMGHRLQNCVGLYKHLNCNILLVEYRGYGLSEGNPTEEGLYIDAKTSLEYLFTRNDINHSEIIVFGRSLGGAVAIDLASRNEFSDKIWCLIIENTFTSIPDMANSLIGWRLLPLLPLFLYKNKFLSKYKMKNLKIPTLFVSGLGDTLVPPKMMNDLYNSCRSIGKYLLQIPEGTHNETWTIDGYYHSLYAFIKNCRLNNDNYKACCVDTENKRFIQDV